MSSIILSQTIFFFGGHGTEQELHILDGESCRLKNCAVGQWSGFDEWSGPEFNECTLGSAPAGASFITDIPIIRGIQRFVMLRILAPMDII